MNIHTVTDEHLYKRSIAPQAVGSSATVNGAGVDCQGTEGLLAIVNIGAIVDSSNITLTVKLQQSSDDGDSDAYADITDATTDAIANDGQNEVYLIELNMSERERYIRAVVTGGSSGGGLVGCVLELFRRRHGVPTQTNTVVQIGFER